MNGFRVMRYLAVMCLLFLPFPALAAEGGLSAALSGKYWGYAPERTKAEFPGGKVAERSKGPMCGLVYATSIYGVPARIIFTFADGLCWRVTYRLKATDPERAKKVRAVFEAASGEILAALGRPVMRNEYDGDTFLLSWKGENAGVFIDYSLKKSDACLARLSITMQSPAVGEVTAKTRPFRR